ncbi:kinetochore protein Spc25 isoform 1-T2 [Guaruba guarouba]
MANVKGEDEIAFFEREIEEFCTKLQSTVSEQITQSQALRDSCREFIKALSEKWSKKLKEMDLMIDKIQEYSNEMLQLSQCISENEGHLTEIKSMLNQEKQQNKDLTVSVQELKEQMKKETSNPKSIEERKEKLCKLKTFYEERLGLEIRKMHHEQLQFIFKHIDHKEPDKPYVCSFSINEQGDYEVTSCNPPLDCIAELQLKVKETNNFSVMVANIRKAFVALSCKQST